MRRHMSALSKVTVTLTLFLLATRLSATSFVVPTDEEMVKKSDAIVIGVVIGSTTIDEGKYLETEYELAVTRVLKGRIGSESRIALRSPGGANEKRWTHVESAAHFRVGEHVLLFLTEHKGSWTPTDLTLGKFRFGLTNKGSAVVHRDATDIIGWDRDGKPHRESLRLENEFLDFITDVVGGHRIRNESEYLADPSEHVVSTDEQPEEDGARKVAGDASKPSDTYAISFYACNTLTRYPGRWPAVMSTGVQFKKNVNQNLGGAGDGGVGTITNALAAWTNDCNSAVNITYGGTSTALRGDSDSDHVVIFNDPSGDVAGSWGGSGTIALTFSGGGGFTEFDGNPNWVDILSSDIVFQNNYTASEPTLNVAMTHEIGHAIGLRHSDASHLKNCAGVCPNCTELPCDANTAECNSSAVMLTTVNSSYGFTLQTWDQTAIGALYPGSCVTVTPPTGVTATATSGTSVTVAWTNSGTATSYNVYRQVAGAGFTKISTDGAVTTTPFIDNTAVSGTAYQYKVRGVNGGTESTDSNLDFTVAMTYTDPTITANSTQVKAVHFTNLVTAANALRSLAGLGAISFTEGTPASTGVIRRSQIVELRAGISGGRTGLGYGAPSFTTDGTITAGVTTIKKAHVDDMRSALQ